MYKALRFKTIENSIVENKDVWIYGTLKNPLMKDTMPQSIIISKNKVTSTLYNENAKILKFLDSNGKYRVFQFNCQWSQNDKVSQIGSVNKMFTSLLSGQSSEMQLGSKKTSMISLISENVNQETIDILSNIYTSPYVYLYVGSGAGNDVEKDWLLVKVVSENYTKKDSKKQFQNLRVEIELPKQYTITNI